jgi:hypothetical protein
MRLEAAGMSEATTTTVAGFIGKASGFVAEALRYWEPRRLLYNAALGAVVVGHMAVRWPDILEYLSLNLLLFLFLLGVLANVCYCAVYAVDLFVRFSGLEAAWHKSRPLVLLIGTAFAGVITHFFAMGLLSTDYNR